MTDFSYLDGQIGEAAEQFNNACKTPTQVREGMAQNLLSASTYDSPEMFQVLHILLTDEKYLALEKPAEDARRAMKQSAAVPSGPLVSNTREEAELLRDENPRRATWGQKEVDGPGSKWHYIMTVAAAHGISAEGGEALQEALNKSYQAMQNLEQRREMPVQLARQQQRSDGWER